MFALHCDPKLEVGTVGFRAGPITAGADRICVTMRGPGGHTARPHLTADLVYALGAVVTELPALLSRRADPRAGLSVVWGQVHAGSAANAIPQQGFAEGTIRCLDADVWESAHNVVPDLVRRLAAPYGVDVDIDMHTSVPPCVNDEAQTAFLRAVGARHARRRGGPRRPTRASAARTSPGSSADVRGRWPGSESGTPKLPTLVTSIREVST